MSNRLMKVVSRKNRRQHRTRASITTGTNRPRLHAFVSNQHVSAQIINDAEGVTLVASSTAGQKSLDKKSLTEKAAWVGADIAKKAKAKKIKTVAFDRGARVYHGRLKQLADAAREAGLEF